MLREPTVAAYAQQQTDRTWDLERQKLTSVQERRDHPPLRIGRSGAVATGKSPPATFPTGATVTAMILLLGTAGTSDTSVQLQRNGTALVGGTLATGETMKVVSAGYGFTPTDKVTVNVSAAGTGAKDLTGQMVYR